MMGWLFRLVFVAVLGCAGITSAQEVAPAMTSADMAPLSGAAPVDYYDGLRAWENGAPELAVSLWLRATAYGDGRAMARVSELYLAGDVLPAQPLLAAQYQALAARFGGVQQADLLAGLDETQRTAVQAAVAAFRPVAIAGTGDAAARDDFDLLVNAIYAGSPAEVEAIWSDRSLGSRTDANDWTALFHAAASGRPDVVEVLLGRDPLLRRVAGDQRFSVLHVAAWSGNVAVIDKLIGAGAYVLAETSSGMRASDVAAEAGHSDAAAHLAGLERAGAKAFQAHLNELGYDVGTPDGDLGPRSRMQIAVLGNAIARQDLMSPAYLFAAAARNQTDYWGVIYSFQKTDGGESVWEGRDPMVQATSAEAAKTQALEACAAQESATKCTVDAVLPHGSCVALATTDRVWEWSKVFAVAGDAETAALAACKEKGGGSDCAITESFCAGME